MPSRRSSSSSNVNNVDESRWDEGRCKRDINLFHSEIRERNIEAEIFCSLFTPEWSEIWNKNISLAWYLPGNDGWDIIGMFFYLFISLISFHVKHCSHPIWCLVSACSHLHLCVVETTKSHHFHDGEIKFMGFYRIYIFDVIVLPPNCFIIFHMLNSQF